MKKLDRVRQLAPVAVGSLFFLGNSAYAQVALDTTAIETQIANVQTAIIAIGAAMVVLAAVAMGYRWLKGFVAAG